jgi:hypothetical protein
MRIYVQVNNQDLIEAIPNRPLTKQSKNAASNIIYLPTNIA